VLPLLSATKGSFYSPSKAALLRPQQTESHSVCWDPKKGRFTPRTKRPYLGTQQTECTSVRWSHKKVRFASGVKRPFLGPQNMECGFVRWVLGRAVLLSELDREGGVIQCFAVMGSGGWFEILGAETEVRDSCSEVKRRNSCRLIWRVNQRMERGDLAVKKNRGLNVL